MKNRGSGLTIFLCSLFLPTSLIFARENPEALFNMPSDSITAMAFEQFYKISQLDCTYHLAEVIGSPDIAEVECENAVKSKNSGNAWKLDWSMKLKEELSQKQFDSLCVNIIRVFRGDQPLPVGKKVQANSSKLKSLHDEAQQDLYKLAD